MSVNGASAGTTTALIQLTAPGVFGQSPGSAAIVNQDGNLNSQSQAAGAGSVIAVYLTGLGAVNPPVTTGAAAGAGSDVMGWNPALISRGPREVALNVTQTFATQGGGSDAAGALVYSARGVGAIGLMFRYVNTGQQDAGDEAGTDGSCCRRLANS